VHVPRRAQAAGGQREASPLKPQVPPRSKTAPVPAKGVEAKPYIPPRPQGAPGAAGIEAETNVKAQSF